MSVATECAPEVYIPERARRTSPGAPAVARPRHLVAVPDGAQWLPGEAEAGSLPGGYVYSPEELLAGSPAVISEAGGLLSAKLSPRSAPVRLTRRGVVVAVLATLMLGALLLVAAWASAGAAPSAKPSIAPGATITVQPGDTLWSIAQRAAPSSDPRGVVEQLRQVNHLKSVALTPGQTLKVE